MTTSKRPAPVRSPDQTTFTWSLSKELKAKLLLVAERDGRPLSNYLSHVLTPQVETILKTAGIVVTDDMIETTLNESAEKAFRGMPQSRKK